MLAQNLLIEKARRLTLLPLVATIFFCVSGGPFGLEPLMKNGVWVGLLLLLAIPVVWAIPTALMTAELSSAMPVEGGYYVWAREAMAAFLCGWWSWVYSWLDTALYPSLFFAYLKTLWVQLDKTPLPESGWLKWGVGLGLIIPLTYLNVRGARPTGQVTVILGSLLLVPFAALVVMGLPHTISHFPTGFTAPGQSPGAALGAGLFVAMWNYLGWDSMSTVAGEVENPTRTFPRALAIGVPLVVLCYFLPALVGVANYPDLSKWDEGAWTNVAGVIGGPWLAIAMTLAGVVSAAGMFSADLLSASRLPFVLAEDRYLPARLARRSGHYQTPVVAIGVSAIMCAIFSFEYFQNLLEVDVVMYSGALILEFVALIVLRRRQPSLPRPFKIPGGMPGAVLVAIVPTLVVLAGLVQLLGDKGSFGAKASAGGLTSGIVAYPICRAYSRRSL